MAKFVMEFNVMRTAAVRFARGDDPEDIKRGMMEDQQAEKGPLNRQQRRMMAKKGKKKGAAKPAGFGRR